MADRLPVVNFSRTRPTRVVVVGGSAAGMSAASKAKRVDPSLDVLVVERSPHVAYSACGIPHLVAGVVDDPAKLQVMTAQGFRDQRGIEVRTFTEVEDVDVRKKRLFLHDLVSGNRHEEPYDRLVLAVGARPVRPPIPGMEWQGVFTLQTLEDGIRLRNFIDSRRPRKAVIVGGGYIAVEMAEAFRLRDLAVAVVEQRDRVLPGYEPEIADAVAETLEKHGVRLHLRETVQRIEAEAAGPEARVELAGSRQRLGADLVLVAAGVEPETGLAVRARVRLGPTAAVHTDWKMRTSQAGIYAAGDCVESRHLVSGQPVYVPLGTTANKQGRVAGDTLAGGRSTFRGVVGTAIFVAFGLEVARTGLNMQEAEGARFRPIKTVVQAPAKATYFPGSGRMTVVLISDRTSRRLLGAQLMGPQGAGKRIDVFAAALHNRCRLDDLAHLDLAYAPPVAPVWDPILVAANVAAKQADHS